MPEEFKSFREITSPDPRNLAWVTVSTENGDIHPVTLEQCHEDLVALNLGDGVPEDVRDHFLTARHLALYSWFVYRFRVVAQLQAYGSLEYALRTVFERLKVNHPRGLRGLLELAVSRRMLSNERFRDWPGHSAEPVTAKDEEWLGLWIERMPEIVGYLRNDLAHGSFTLMPQYGVALRFCADAINQLFADGT